jgi:hypothetical protein
MGKYKVVVNNKNLFGKETFKKRSEAKEAIDYTNKGAKLLGQKSAAKNAKIVLISRKRSS